MRTSFQHRRWGLGAFLLAVSTLAPAATLAPSTVDQGWSKAQVDAWYSLSQGSRLIPLAWLKALEQADAARPFLLREHTEKFRYLPDDSADPAPLPMGFVVDTQNDRRFSEITKLRWRKNQSEQEPWVGMNCAACHSNAITYKGATLRIEGAPTLADYQGYLKSLNQALQATQADPAKWTRFADKALGQSNDAASQQMLKAAFAKLLDWQLKVERANATELQYGFARVDAFGHIFNKVLLRTEGNNQPTNPSDAPVSYPFLWNVPQHDKVQWNGIAPNKKLGSTIDIGALGRNVGEVIGVFADLTLLPPGPAIIGYPNSAQVKNLLTLEDQLGTLKPPNWPQAFPAIDAAKWEAGKALFYKSPNSCVGCHAALPRDDLSTPIIAQMIPLKAIGTDPWMACNAYTYQAKSGWLEHTPEKFFIGVGTPYGEEAAVADLLGTAVIGVIWNKGPAIFEDLKKALLATDPFKGAKTVSASDIRALSAFAAGPDMLPPAKKARLQHCLNDNNPLLAYKGRPLGGIWATPPYLHNGSVPTLFDLLLPPSQRPASFRLGTREFDPERVGFVTDQSQPVYQSPKAQLDNVFVFQARTSTGTAIPGNSNAGHDYGNASLTDTERWALVEYMKAVGASRVGDRVVP